MPGMVRDERCGRCVMSRQDTEPITGKQCGALMGEFVRLGYGYRPVRIEATQILTGRPDLCSTWELLMGEAGRLLHQLRQVQDQAELVALIESETDRLNEVEEDPDPKPVVPPLVEVLGGLIVALVEGRRAKRGR